MSVSNLDWKLPNLFRLQVTDTACSKSILAAEYSDTALRVAAVIAEGTSS